MSETPMVERVARAICLSSNGNPDRIHSFAMGERDVPEWRLDVDEARAAIQAMREPTNAMADAGRWPGEDGEPKAAWRAMIDAALAAPEEGRET